MKKIELYDRNKTYMFPNGAIATPAEVASKYPATALFDHMIETDESGEVLFAIQNLSAMKSLHGIAKDKHKDAAIIELEELINRPQELKPTADERIAAAMEFQNLMASDGGFTPDASIVEDNFKKGLWNKNMVSVAVSKKAIQAAKYKDITGEEHEEVIV